MQTILITVENIKLDNSHFVTSTEFIAWAKEDLKQKTKRSIGNAIGNIKKAIHCRIDEILDLTHIKYCKDWSPRPNTDTKLEALSILNIKFSGVVTLLIKIRNDYEHLYKLANYIEAQQYLDTADMWLTYTYDKCTFNKISIPELRVSDFGVHYDHNSIPIVTSCVVDKTSGFDYFWDSKREIHEIKKGKLKIIKMNTVEWKKMAAYEAKHLRFQGTPNRSEFLLPSKVIINIYKKIANELVV